MAKEGGRLGRLATVLLLGGVMFAGRVVFDPAAAQQPTPFTVDESEPALISADELIHDEKRQLVTARGNVEISQGGRVLVADSVSYDIAADVVTASGNVALVEKSGDVIFADYIEVTGDLREGFVRDIRVLLSDRSKMAAASGVRTSGNRTDLSRVVYSPCDLCKEDPTRAPLWQLKADRVVHDQEAKTVKYRDARLEMFGVPVFYTPYFQHPDPSVDRQSGLLTPSISRTDPLGLVLRVPYFLVIDETSDVKLTPFLTTKENGGLVADYRKLFEKGYLNVEVSGTYADVQENDGSVDDAAFRGHIAGSGLFDIDETFRWGFNVKRATDDTYLRVYDLGDENTLTSNAFVEAFDGRSYASLNGYAFQALRLTDDSAQQPIVLPLLEGSYIGEPDRWGGVTRIDANLLSIFRLEGRATRRLGVAGAYTLPYVSDWGDIWTFTAKLEGEGYWANDYDPSQPDNVDPDVSGSEFAGRLFPQLAAQWRYPFVQHSRSFSQVIEPIAQLRLAPPYRGDQDDIPNEDSEDLEFDDTNLFDLNRFPGEDRVDPGPRVDYGLKYSLFDNSGAYGSFFVGQSYRFTSTDVYEEGSGLEDHVSDFVGRLQVSPAYWLDGTYRFLVDKDDFAFKRHEVSLYAGVPEFNVYANYIFSDEALQDPNSLIPGENQSQLYVRVSSQFTKYWTVFASHRQDFDTNTALSTRFGLRYLDECCLIEAIYERADYEDNINPGNAFFLRIGFKNLGEISLD